MYLKASFLGLLEPAETEVYASAFGERFYGTTARALRESENEIKFSHQSQPSPWRSCLAFRGSPGGFSWLSLFILYQRPALLCR